MAGEWSFNEIFLKIALPTHWIVIITQVSISVVMDSKLLGDYCVGKVVGPIKSGWLKFYFG